LKEREKGDELEKKTLLSVDRRFGVWRDVGLADEFVCGLAITSLFAIVQDVNIEPVGWRGEREISSGERRGTFYRHPMRFGRGL
jgi:hypothetical protein